ncbi:PQQ-binding-like beta-propeller repeat protein [Spartinivicinus poritis]|uniref:PQQ-binding-like beta-propeller repeat protein n=1 Tax=Spartinivicinus poritis TaxID=2994640 RepID=A0ABT5UDH1_9GAMM|nr:PQQ-binding-like beta-propeller repeat protein [Spartinivicinus sp. A2-2]MDE1464419.1 PQQ-binding-like beta-propeller repeat protein [Spartinivicinus sp. A2-2]
MNYINDSVEYIPLIVPTVLIPFTILSVAISVVAAFIAGLFGIKLKTEGPKQLLEILLKPKVLFVALVVNILIYGGYKGYQYVHNLPSFEWVINKQHQPIQLGEVNYSELLSRSNKSQESNLLPKSFNSIKQQWKIKLPMGAFRTGALSGNSLFFGADDGYIHELSTENGQTLRKFFIGTIVTPSPIVFNGYLFAGEGTHDTHHARIYKINLTTGKHEAPYSTKGHTEGQPVIGKYQGQALLFAVAGSDGIHAIDPHTMKQVWHQTPGHMDAAVRVDDGIVYVGTGREKGDSQKHRSYAIAYEFMTGKEIWKHEIPASSWMEPAITSEYACFIMGEIYFETKLGGVNCYDKVTGEPQFSILNKSPVIGIPFVLNEDIIFSDLSGQVCRIDTSKRTKKWCFDSELTGKHMTSVSYDYETNILAYTTANKGVMFLNPSTGKLLHHYLPSVEEGQWEKTYASAISVGSNWVTVDIEGNVRKLLLE